MSTDADTNTDTHADRKHRYESVLRTIEYQTGGPNQASNQPAGAKQSSIVVVAAARGEWTGAGVRKTITAAVANDDVLHWYDDGPRVARATEDGLRAVIAAENQSQSPDTSLIERAAALL